MGTVRILCLEDDEADFELLNYALKKSGLEFISRRVDTRAEFEEALTEFMPGLILSDHALPQFDSLEALKICQARFSHIPFILVTGAVSEEFAVNCLKIGASDYLLKSNLSRLRSAIDAALKNRRTEVEKHQAVAELAFQNEALKKTNFELDSLVYSVSHNLRAPLMSVLGLLNLARQERDRKTLRDLHGMMEQSIHRLDDTLHEILDFSRNARQEMKYARVDIRHMLSDHLSRMEFMPGYERLEITRHIEDAVPYYSDPYRISLVVGNLVSNAIKYHDPARDKCWLKITATVNRENLNLRFEDNGIGIAPEHMPAIFNMFYRATGKKQGSGLGLFIVKEALEKLEGEVSVTSEPGRGTCFEVTIPNRYRSALWGKG